MKKEKTMAADFSKQLSKIHGQAIQAIKVRIDGLRQDNPWITEDKTLVVTFLCDIFSHDESNPIVGIEIGLGRGTSRDVLIRRYDDCTFTGVSILEAISILESLELELFKTNTPDNSGEQKS